MDLGIAGKVALVAGGSKGMGRATARQLAAEGCKVAIVARDHRGIDEAVAELERSGIAMGVSADLATEAGAQAAVAAIRAQWGAPEILVAQTNDTGAGFFFDIANDDYERVFRTFTMSVVYLARAVLPDMQARRWGRIIHIGSSAAKEPAAAIPHVLANTVRPSTVGLLKSLADEFAKIISRSIRSRRDGSRRARCCNIWQTNAACPLIRPTAGSLPIRAFHSAAPVNPRRSAARSRSCAPNWPAT